MKITLLSRSAWLLVAFFLAVSGNSLASTQDSIRSVLTLPEDKINLSEIALLISKEWDPSLDLNAYRTKLNQLTEKTRKQIAGKTSPDTIVAALRQIIHQEEGYAYTDQVDENNIPLDPAEIFLHGLLDTKRGYCMTLSLLYLIIGENLGLPLHGIALPNHFFVRYEAKNSHINIETTQSGSSLPDSYYRQRFGISAGRESFFLTPLKKKQTLGSYFSNVGMTYYKQAKPDSAVSYLNLAVQINPESIEAHNNLGNIFAELKQYGPAIEQYLLALKWDPDNISTLFNLGITYSDAGDDTKAIDALLQVVQIDPSYIPAHRSLTQLYLNRKRYISALLHLKKLVAMEPENIQTRLAMADAYLRLNQFDLSLDVLKKTQSLSPENPDVSAKLAEAYYRMGNFDMAIAQYRRLIEYNPDRLEAYIQLGWTLYKKGDIKMAIAWTKRGLSKTEEPPQYIVLAHMNLGLYYLLNEEFSEAESWYRKALSSNAPNILDGMIKDLEETAGSFQKLAEIDYFTGWLFFEGGQKEKAKPFLDRYLKRAGNGALAEKARNLLNKISEGAHSLTSATPMDSPAETPDRMALIPEGFFIMGSNNHGEDEMPEHKVFLDAYFIDKYEVNAAEYAEFLNTFGNAKRYYTDDKFGTLEYDKKFFPRDDPSYPINNVSWLGAASYCRWKGKRLPTEAEWEKAARGLDGRIYPWGNAKPSPDLARYFQTWTEEIKLKVLVPVDSMPQGKSPYGIHHMAGNVKEWVDDWFDREYYLENEHKENPLGPIGGEFKVIKGGSWRDLPGHIYSSFRNDAPPENRLDDYGFRCAKSVKATSNQKFF